MTTSIQVTRGQYQNLFFMHPYLWVTSIGSDQYHLSEVGAGRDRAVTLHGYGFAYQPATPDIIGGTITSIDIGNTSYFYDHYSPTISSSGGYSTVSGLSIDATTFYNFYLASNWAAIEALIFPGAVVFNASDTLPSYRLGGITYVNQTADAFSGGAFNDVLIGRNGNDTLKGMGGDDYINGGADNDALLGGDGADLIYGEGGDDRIWAGRGNNIVLAGDGNDTIFGDGGDDVLYGETGNDVLLAGAGASFAVGGAGDDQIWGEDGADYLMGEDGADTLFGGSGDDAVVAGSGADELYGGDGVDALYGGTGSDLYFGGAGTDFFYIHADGPTAGEIDIVADFAATDSGAPDYLVLSSAFRDGTIIYADTTYTWVATAVTGGFHYVALTNTSPDIVAAQIIWV